MNWVKGSLIAILAFGAGFVAAMVAEPYIPGRAKDLRVTNESLTKENEHLRMKVKMLEQPANQDAIAVPEATDPAAKSAPSRSE